MLKTIRIAKKIGGGESVSIFDAVHMIPDGNYDFKWLGYRLDSNRNCNMYMLYEGHFYKVLTWFPDVHEYVFRVEEVPNYLDQTEPLSEYQYVVDVYKHGQRYQYFFKPSEFQLAQQAFSNMRESSQLYNIF